MFYFSIPRSVQINIGIIIMPRQYLHQFFLIKMLIKTKEEVICLNNFWNDNDTSPEFQIIFMIFFFFLSEILQCVANDCFELSSSSKIFFLIMSLCHSWVFLRQNFTNAELQCSISAQNPLFALSHIVAVFFSTVLS